jgi:E3 ubiquitin-protein ligase RNF13
MLIHFPRRVMSCFSAPLVKGSGECGVLYLAKPLDACSALTNKAERASNASSPFVLIIRGGCSFEDKVRRAQKAGFKAAIVYDNEDDGVLVASNELFLHEL